MSEWQPIETAPKDGTRILAADTAGFVDVYYFAAAIRGPGGWMDETSDFPDFPLTHWMPLPEPPK